MKASYAPAIVGLLAVATIGLAAGGADDLLHQSAVAVHLVKPADHPIENGWYPRADSKAIGSGITSWNMSLGETGVRCLCGPAGFRGADDGEGFFVVTAAPEGYSDTIGRRFKSKQAPCLNCAD